MFRTNTKSICVVINRKNEKGINVQQKVHCVLYNADNCIIAYNCNKYDQCDIIVYARNIYYSFVLFALYIFASMHCKNVFNNTISEFYFYFAITRIHNNSLCVNEYLLL